MTLEQISSHPIYSILSPQEQVFILAYFSTKGSISTSIKQAYPNAKNIPDLARKLLARENVVAILDFIDGDEMPSKNSLVKIAYRWLRKSNKAYEAYRGIEIVSDLLGYGVKHGPEQEELQKLKNDLARRLDENGK